jgi:hypothetical protein
VLVVMAMVVVAVLVIVVVVVVVLVVVVAVRISTSGMRYFVSFKQESREGFVQLTRLWAFKHLMAISLKFNSLPIHKICLPVFIY